MEQMRKVEKKVKLTVELMLNTQLIRTLSNVKNTRVKFFELLMTSMATVLSAMKMRKKKFDYLIFESPDRGCSTQN